MALTETESQAITEVLAAFLERKRPPLEIRHEVDLAYRIERQSVILFEVRPAWQGPADAIIEIPIAKATYVRKHGHWRVYWQRADLKWHRYDPTPQTKTLNAFLSIVEQDQYACFFG